MNRRMSEAYGPHDAVRISGWHTLRFEQIKGMLIAFSGSIQKGNVNMNFYYREAGAVFSV